MACSLHWPLCAASEAELTPTRKLLQTVSATTDGDELRVIPPPPPPQFEDGSLDYFAEESTIELAVEKSGDFTLLMEPLAAGAWMESWVKGGAGVQQAGRQTAGCMGSRK